MKRIETTSPLYLKRMVRELNSVGMLDGFYAPVATMVVRCNAARLRKGVLEVHSYYCFPEWFVPTNNVFTNGNGGTVCASTVL